MVAVNHSILPAVHKMILRSAVLFTGISAECGESFERGMAEQLRSRNLCWRGQERGRAAEQRCAGPETLRLGVSDTP